jgi:hypothetical protein
MDFFLLEKLVVKSAGFTLEMRGAREAGVSWQAGIRILLSYNNRGMCFLKNGGIFTFCCHISFDFPGTGHVI